ncbi:DNA cytosine methyltransferase [Pseudomonadales bacterium]|nr:DNA cytosine methyltransferase [Pseudomonadales bacterium]
MPIKVIDLFAGCGGIGEGFAAAGSDSERVFEIELSVESDKNACDTLRLRKFFWEFEIPPDAYYQYVRGEIDKEQMIALHPEEWARAQGKVLCEELGDNEFTDVMLPKLIEQRIGDAEDWILVGGPPCQAYSAAGVARNRGKKNYSAEKDGRHFLYKQYLKIIGEFAPPMFLMENVPGILSSKVGGERIFPKILEDLENPVASLGLSDSHRLVCPGYRIFSVAKPSQFDMFHSIANKHSDFIVKSEEYGVPQSRHRVFLLGVRLGLEGMPETLEKRDQRFGVKSSVCDLPRIRSALSVEDRVDKWVGALGSIPDTGWFKSLRVSSRREGLTDAIEEHCRSLVAPRAGIGSRFVKSGVVSPKILKDWIGDARLGGACNHESRAHMESDLHRYMFASTEMAFREADASPIGTAQPAALRISEFPSELLPNHENVKGKNDLKLVSFSDRFKVQRANAPASTIVSHIAKDGHYFIHYDPSQCRSLTVREAARLQTFPDNFFFEGSRGAGYKQVGNAVPPYLAMQIAELVSNYFSAQKS